MNYDMMRYETHLDQDVKCPDCGHETNADVSVDTLAGVACYSCPECGRTVEA